MNRIINNSLSRSISYNSYRDLFKELVDKQASTSLEQTEALTDYTKLNHRRMKRWDKTIKISDENKAKIKALKTPITLLTITESWCGDAAHVLPVLNKITDLNPVIDLKIVLRDKNQQLMDAFLTNGNRAIPKVIIIDTQSGDVLNTYGPRPSKAASFVNQYKTKYGALTPEFKEDLQHWYNQDKGENIVNDITKLLCKLEASACLQNKM